MSVSAVRPAPLAFALAGVLLLSCYAPPDDQPSVPDTDPPVVTENFISYTSETRARWLEKQYQAVSNKLGFFLRKPIIYNRLKTGECAERYCEREHAFELRCLPGDRHCMFRLAQLYADELGDAPAFLRDGLAEIIAGGLAFEYGEGLGPDFTAIPTYFDDERYREVREPHAFYGLSKINDEVARFVRTMIDELTLGEFVAFYRASSRDRSRWKPETGRSLEEWVTLAQARTPAVVSNRGYRLALAECEAPVIASGVPETWGWWWKGTVQIYQPGLVTPNVPQPRVFTFSLAETSEVTVRVVGEERTFFVVEPCYFEPTANLWAGLPTTPLGWRSGQDSVEGTDILAPGSYFLYAGGVPTEADPERVEVEMNVEVVK